MKVFAMFAALATTAATVCGQSGSPVQHSLGLNVRVVSSGGAVHSDAGSSANLGALQKAGGGGKDKVSVEKYTRSREAQSGLGLVAEVSNLSSLPDSAKVEWFFFGQGVKQDSEDFISGLGSRDVTVRAASTEKVEVDSPDLTSREEKHLTITKGNNTVGHAVGRKKSGARTSGWLVRLVVDGKVAAVRASSPSLEAAGRDETRLKAFRRKLQD